MAERSAQNTTSYYGPTGKMSIVQSIPMVASEVRESEANQGHLSQVGGEQVFLPAKAVSPQDLVRGTRSLAATVRAHRASKQIRTGTVTQPSQDATLLSVDRRPYTRKLVNKNSPTGTLREYSSRNLSSRLGVQRHDRLSPMLSHGIARARSAPLKWLPEDNGLSFNIATAEPTLTSFGGFPYLQIDGSVGQLPLVQLLLPAIAVKGFGFHLVHIDHPGGFYFYKDAFPPGLEIGFQLELDVNGDYSVSHDGSEIISYSTRPLVANMVSVRSYFYSPSNLLSIYHNGVRVVHAEPEFTALGALNTGFTFTNVSAMVFNDFLESQQNLQEIFEYALNMNDYQEQDFILDHQYLMRKYASIVGRTVS